MNNKTHVFSALCCLSLSIAIASCGPTPSVNCSVDNSYEDGEFVVYLALNFFTLYSINWYKIIADFQNAHVGLIVSAVMSDKKIRELEIYWRFQSYQKGDLIVMFAEEPHNESRPIYRFAPARANGLAKTGIEAEFIPTSNLTFVRRCLST